MLENKFTHREERRYRKVQARTLTDLGDAPRVQVF